ncbi:MAG: 16S rRNA (guanine(527)-N(7))-methyltransferase RsmG [Oscillospiraceae bacterium]|nr:16S rRNA (guanine(527)-N(7))-methyltransferase RsmG [Oscillospiraceae bacterium]
MLPKFDAAKALFDEYGLDVSRETYDKMEQYAAFLVDYNEKVNLTAVTEGSEILRKHFLDSVLLAKYGNIPENASLLDIGSGAGFPGVPLALVRQDLHITLLDSLNKRIVFLQQLCELLGCSYTAMHGRAELAAKTPEMREKFDVVTARAVAAMPTLAEYSLPFVKVGGTWIAMKGPNEPIKPALQAIRMLGGSLEDTIEYTLPGGDARVIYVVKKISQTPTKYPRNSGQIKQKPL